ncbi:MAG: tRNA pseudouridine(55) synthase TruB [Candidatus Krumholzibacteria bacterium]|nr:tRNA pseudouridine(55) synthase TruB [Candidatus Krumholzibacteria bacterium]
MTAADGTAVSCDPAGGVLLVDKPAGVTSFAVVNAVRKALVQAFPELVSKRVKGGPKPPRFKCGHAGTLDPLATGLLVVLVGKGSRLSNFLLGMDKTYAATVRFGTATDSLDADGEVVCTAPAPTDEAVIKAALDQFRGAISQVPPLVSALKKDGQPLYKLVRAGKDVAEPAARPVTINKLELVATRLAGPEPEADLLVGCSSGTYIRSLARDLATAVDSVGHIAQLRRLDVGPFDVADAVTDVMTITGAEVVANMRPLTAALPQAPLMEVTAEEAASLRLGHQPEPDWIERLDGPPVAMGRKGTEPLFRMVDTAGELVAVGRIDEESGEPRIAVGIPRQT